MELRLEAALPGGAAGGAQDPEVAGGGGWTVCWAARVAFSDDAARAAALQRLCERREQLQVGRWCVARVCVTHARTCMGRGKLRARPR